MGLIRTVEQIHKMYMENSDCYDASSYEVQDLCEEIFRLRDENEQLSNAAGGRGRMEVKEAIEVLKSFWRVQTVPLNRVQEAGDVVVAEIERLQAVVAKAAEAAGGK